MLRLPWPERSRELIQGPLRAVNRAVQHRSVVFPSTLVIALGSLLVGCAPADDGGRGELPNVIIYLVDTLRHDHLGVYGYGRDTSPVLDALARDAVVFEQAYSPTSWTKPAAASLLSGLNPLRHRAVNRVDIVGPEIRLLSEVLQAAGFHTAAVVANPNVLPLFGFDQGFDSYDDVDSVGRRTRADAVMDVGLRRLDGFPARRPFFLYMHPWDPHAPYAPPPPYDSRFTSQSDPAIAGYDGEIAFGDMHFGRLIERLKRDGQYDDSMIVFVSDHGEEFHEHGGDSHGHTLYQEVVRIPLIIKFPSNAHAGQRVAAPASLVDVVPTVMAVLGRPPIPGLDGIDLGSLVSGEDAALAQRPVYMDLDLNWRLDRADVVRGVSLGRLKYLRRLSPVREEMLFDLEQDPGETENLLAVAPVEAARLGKLLDAYISETSTGIHLRLINERYRGERICTGLLRTTGRFVDLSERLLEPGDRVELSDGGKILSFEFTLKNYPHPTGGVPPVIRDEDGLVFRMEPVDAPVVFEQMTTAQGARFPLSFGPDHRPTVPPVTFDAMAGELAIEDAARLLIEGEPPRAVAMGAYLAVVHEAAKQEAVPDDVRERLQALGYLGGATR